MKYLIILLSTVFIFHSCMLTNGVQGNKDITSEEFDISDYSQIDLWGSALLVYEQKAHAKPYLRLEVDENLLEYISIEVIDSKLIIKNTGNINPSKYNIYTNSTTLTEAALSGSGNLTLSDSINTSSLTISLNGSGKIEGENLKCKDLIVNVSGSGSAIVAGSSEKSSLKLNGSGKILAEDMLSSLSSNNTVVGSGHLILKGNTFVEEMHMILQGSGKMDIKGINCGNLNAELQGSGNIVINGTSSITDMKVHGSGKISAKDLTIKNAKSNVSGSGGIYLNVTDSLKAGINGSGNIRYTGAPGYVDKSISGSGSVTSE